MPEKKRVVASVTLRHDRPTEVTFEQLYSWVIWQFPRRKTGGMCGATRPPIPDHTWFPALIKQSERRVIIHGHIDEEFSTPEAAAEWVESYSHS